MVPRCEREKDYYHTKSSITRGKLQAAAASLLYDLGDFIASHGMYRV